MLQSVSTSYRNVLSESLQTLPTERPAHHSSNSFAGCRCLTDRVKYRKALLVFKSAKGLAPDYMCELFESVQMVSSRNTRSNARDDLYVPRARTQLFQSTLTIYGANIINKLSTAIRSCNSVADFKRAYMREICH